MENKRRIMYWSNSRSKEGNVHQTSEIQSNDRPKRTDKLNMGEQFSRNIMAFL